MYRIAKEYKRKLESEIEEICKELKQLPKGRLYCYKYGTHLYPEDCIYKSLAGTMHRSKPEADYHNGKQRGTLGYCRD